MRNKNLLISAAVLVLVVLALIVGNKLAKQKPGSAKTQYFPGLTENTCSGFTVKDAGQSVKLTRKNGNWVVSDIAAEQQQVLGGPDTPADAPALKEYPADSASVFTALGKLTAMQKGDLISQNPAKQAQLEVDTVKGRLVEVFGESGKSLGSFLIGKSGPDWNSNYVRMVGSDNVYAVAGSIKHAFFTENNRWRDKVLTSFDKLQAKKIALAKNGSEPIVIEETPNDTGSGSSWKIAGSPADPAAVDQILTTMSNLRASDYDDAPLADNAMGLDPVDLKVTVTLKDGNTEWIEMGIEKESSGKIWVRASRKPEYTLQIYKSSVEKLDRKPADFISQGSGAAQ